jgi:hypothetical protein
MSLKTLLDSVVRLTGDVWGESVSYTPNGGSLQTMQGIFTNAWVDIEGVVTLKPTLRIRLGDLTALPAKGDAVVIETVNYRVMESRLDAFGGSTLILQKV